MTKIAFIGGGHIASALVAGAIAKGWPAETIAVAEPDAEKRKRLSSAHNIATVANAAALPQNAAAFILAVRPADAAQALAQTQTEAALVSLVAGLPLAKIKTLAQGATGGIVRAMPNTPAAIGEAMTVLCAAKDAPPAARKIAETVFAAVGKTLWLPEETMMAAATALSGSGPGYVFYFAEAMMEAAREAGFDAAAAETLTLQTLRGAALMAEKSGKTPRQLREAVAVPGGTTERAIQTLNSHDFKKTIQKAITAAKTRAQELSQN